MGTTDRPKPPAAKLATLADISLKPFLRWPGDVSAALDDLPEPTLKRFRIEGDHPRLFALGRAMYTTPSHLLEWLEKHELAPGQKMRPATIPKGTKLGPLAPRIGMHKVAPSPSPSPTPIQAHTDSSPAAPKKTIQPKPGKPLKKRGPAPPLRQEAAEQAA